MAWMIVAALGVLLLVLVAVLVLISRADRKHNDRLMANMGAEVLSGVYDDQHSTVYIKVNKAEDVHHNAAIAYVMAMKKTWELQFPTKRIVAMSVVTGDGGGYGHPMVAGMLIHYEMK